jgi:hypothetical protein
MKLHKYGVGTAKEKRHPQAEIKASACTRTLQLHEARQDRVSRRLQRRGRTVASGFDTRVASNGFSKTFTVEYLVLASVQQLDDQTGEILELVKWCKEENGRRRGALKRKNRQRLLRSLGGHLS